MEIIIFVSTAQEHELKKYEAKGIVANPEDFDCKQDFVDSCIERLEATGIKVDSPANLVYLSPTYYTPKGDMKPLPTNSGLITKDGVSDEYWSFWKELYAEDEKEVYKLIAYLKLLGSSRGNAVEIENIYNDMCNAYFEQFDSHEGFAQRYLEMYHNETVKTLDNIVRKNINLSTLADDVLRYEGFSTQDGFYFKE